MSAPFAHLHCHTHYSLLDGANRIPDLVAKVKELGMNSCAITDHGNLYGALEFYQTCKKEDVNPVLGLEAYIAPGHRTDRSASRMKDASYHLTLLAMNAAGFRNLIKLSTKAYLEGFYYKPRIDKELLEAHSDGVICLSGCASSELSRHLLAEDWEKSERLVKWYSDLFGDRFYMEIQDAGVEIQQSCAEATIELANRMGLPLVATNDAHYLCNTDAAMHDVLLCVNTKSVRDDANRMKISTDQLFIRSPEQMYAAFPKAPDAVARSQEIADRCEIDLDLTKRHFPVFTPPPGKTDVEHLREVAEEGLKWRYGENPEPKFRERLEYELSVIERMGYSSYFLICWDFARFARSHHIPCTARGSACGAIVSYVLGLSDVCPIEYDLLFERFLDPNRTEAPDIDMDFCRDRRELVINYVKDKYGHDSVAQIGTFGTLKAKAAVRDVARALSVPLNRADQIAKMIPDTLNIKLKQALKDSSELKEEYDRDPQVKEVVDMAMALEGLAKSAGTHAAGVVIGDRPLIEYVPLQKLSGKQDVLTQWTDVETAGLLKMDFLGLRNLTILDKAVKNVARHRGVDIVPKDLPLDDKATFALLQRGETKGIFQLESGGMRDLLTKMKPDQFADIIATSALYRPGPLEGGMVMTYVNVKHGREPAPTVHPIIDDVLEETYGVMVYQEQVMRILNRLGGIELAKAYQCIKAISKKKLPIIAQYREHFIAGAQENGMSKDQAEEIFGLIEKFAGYGFNKCVVGETEIIDAESGERSTVGELFENRRSFVIHSLNDAGRLEPRRVTDVVWNGRKAVFELRTRQGNRLRATGNHPLRCYDGWKNLSELEPGDRIAAPRRLDVPTTNSWPEHELIVLAGILSEGNTCHPTCLYFYNDSEDLIDDFRRAAEEFPDTVARIDRRSDGKRLEVCLSTGRDTRFAPGHTPWNAGNVATASPPSRATRSGVYRWADRLRLLGCKAAEKSMPSEVFALNDDDLALFLGRLWAGDGFVGAGGQMPYYATSSPRLARDVQTLLLRIGILSRIHEKSIRYRHRGREQMRAGFTVHLIGTESVESFVELVLPHAVGRDRQIAEFREHLAQLSGERTSRDTIPADVRTLVDEERRARGLTWRDLEAESGVSMREFAGRGSRAKRGFRRSTLGRLAKFFASRRLEQVIRADVFWDTVETITPCDVEDTYDLTVEDHHNFVADGLIVHNSHSTAYGAIAYQTAYLKAHYPEEFMAALLSCGMESSDRISEHTDDCRRMGIEVLRPDVNSSDVEFGVVEIGSEGRRGISFGMGAIKGVGEAAVRAIREEREANGPFRSIFDLTERVDPKQLTKGVLEILIKAGALDSLGGNRAQHLLVMERAIQAASARQRDKSRGQMNLFGGDDGTEDSSAEVDVNLPPAEDWTQSQKLQAEKEVLGFYLTSHPLTQHAERIEGFATHRIDGLRDLNDGQEIVIGGMVSAIKKAATKKPSRNGHSRYVNFDFEDARGVVRCIMWPDDYAREGELIVKDAILLIKGRIDARGREPNVIVNKVYTLDQAEKEFTRQVTLKFRRGYHTAEDMQRVRDILGQYPGKTPVVVVVETWKDEENGNGNGNGMHRNRLRAILSTSLNVSARAELKSELTGVLGEGGFRFQGGPEG